MHIKRFIVAWAIRAAYQSSRQQMRAYWRYLQAKLTRRPLPRYHACYTYSGVAGLGRYLLPATLHTHYTSGDALSFG